MEEHRFALWLPSIDQLTPSFQGLYEIKDSETLHRIKRVLRIAAGEVLIFFGRQKIVSARVCEVHADKVIIACDKIALVVPLKPEIILHLPLLEKPALEEAIRAATVLGVSCICLFTSEKSKRMEISGGELSRLDRIMISAAEQSKQTCLPVVTMPLPLAHISFSTLTIMFDLYAPVIRKSSIFSSTKAIPSHCSIILGPEGDFTKHEREWLYSKGVSACQLTPTILRSEDALMVGVGLIRSFFNEG